MSAAEASSLFLKTAAAFEAPRTSVLSTCYNKEKMSMKTQWPGHGTWNHHTAMRTSPTWTLPAETIITSSISGHEIRTFQARTYRLFQLNPRKLWFWPARINYQPYFLAELIDLQQQSPWFFHQIHERINQLLAVVLLLILEMLNWDSQESDAENPLKRGNSTSCLWPLFFFEMAKNQIQFDTRHAGLSLFSMVEKLRMGGKAAYIMKKGW